MNESDDLQNSIILKHFNVTQPEHFWSYFQCCGPSHKPTYKINLLLDDVVFEGYGPSKISAKIDAIKKFNLTKTDEVANSCIKNESSENKDKIYTTNVNKNLQLELYKPEFTVPRPSAVRALEEIFQGQNIIYEFHYEDDYENVPILAHVTVGGFTYSEYGQNYVEAQDLACRRALENMCTNKLIDVDKFHNKLTKLKTNYADTKIIDHFAYITDVEYQNIKFNNPKHKEYSVIASFIKVNK